MRAHTSRHCLILCAIVSSVATSSMVPWKVARAQDTPSIFLHGLSAVGSAWASVGDYLSSTYTITVNRPTIGRASILSGITEKGGYGSLASMVTELQNYLTPPTQYAVVAHSVGGLVARERILATAQAGQPRQINRLLTVATPHRGAPLAKTVLGGLDRQLRPLDQQFGIMNNMVPWMGPAGLDASPFYYELWGPALQQMAASRSGFDVHLTVLIPFLAPITTELNPDAALYPTLNHPSSLAHENGIDRVSIVGTTSNDALFAKAWTPGFFPNTPAAEVRSRAQNYEQIRAAVAKAFLVSALISGVIETRLLLQNGLPPCISEAIHSYKYDSCIDHVKRTAYLLAAWYVLDRLNPKWAGWIGAHGDNTTDALLPDSTQFYPGLPLTNRIFMSDAWHGLETRESGAVIARVLDFWRIAPRVQPLTNSISKSDYFYTANATGGQLPYSFLWEWCAIDCQGGGDLAPSIQGGVHPNTVSRGWSVLSTAQTVYVNLRQRTLRSTVTDAAGQQAVATYYIP